MTKIYTLEQIKSVLDYGQLIAPIEQGFVLYSQNKVVVSPVGHLGFHNPTGDVHIKYGYIQENDYYVIKIASGFYDNPKRGLPSSNGLMLVFSQKTGELIAVLLDEGYLTDIRTAVAGAVVAKYLAPKQVKAIGIVGTGIQARLQLELLASVTDCTHVYVWGRSQAKLDQYKTEMEPKGFTINTTRDISELTSHCNLIVTTTPSIESLLFADQIQPGTHITAMGADTKGKQELDTAIFAKAAIVVADSIDQCVDHGDIARAVEKGIVSPDRIIELGTVIGNPALHRKNDSQITIADLTGVAVQDIQIATYVLAALTKSVLEL